MSAAGFKRFVILFSQLCVLVFSVFFSSPVHPSIGRFKGIFVLLFESIRERICADQIPQVIQLIWYELVDRSNFWFRVKTPVLAPNLAFPRV